MKFWQALSFMELDHMLEVARIAEEVGFHGVFLSDHLFYPEKIESPYPYTEDGVPPFAPETDWPEPWCAISAMAAVTERIEFCTMVYILPLRDPFEVAKAVATAAILSNNRVILGAGVGWMKEEFDLLARDFRTRGKRFNEMIEVMRQLWTGEMVEYHGTYYEHPRLLMRPAPTRPIPIYMGGQSKPALQRAARLGDGWIGSAAYTPEEIPGLIAYLRTQRKEAGRDHLLFDYIAPLAVPADPDLYRRLEDEGVTAITSGPFSYELGPGSTLDQKRRLMEQYAENVILKMK